MTQNASGTHYFAIGDPVEICPYPKDKECAFEVIGRLDGHSAQIIGIAKLHRNTLARVKVNSKDKEKNGIWRVPIECLKIIRA